MTYEDELYIPYPDLHKEPEYDDVTGRNVDTFKQDEWLEEEEEEE